MATEKKTKGGRKCWCKDTGYRGQAHPVHGRARRLKGVEALIADLDSLRDDENDDPLGQLLGRAIAALRQAARQTTPETLVVITMDSESKDWVAVGRTEQEARAALARKWDEVVPPGGGQKWAAIKGSDDKGDAADYYGARVMHVVPGRAYMNGFDERT